MVNYFLLIGSGMLTGILHVLQGPDHFVGMAALLSANSFHTVGDCPTSTKIGIRWGMGHSIGLFLANFLLIFFAESDDDEDDNIVKYLQPIPDSFSNFMESLGGICMILLGLYGWKQAWKKRPKVYATLHDSDREVPVSPIQQPSPKDDEDDDFTFSIPAKTVTTGSSIHGEIDGFHHQHEMVDTEEIVDSRQESNQSQQPKVLVMSPSEDSDTHEEVLVIDMEYTSEGIEEVLVTPYFCCGWASCIFSSTSMTNVAFGLGMIHGLAGMPDLLRVLPEVLQSEQTTKLVWILWTSLYWITFCVTSSLAMGCFAALYSICTARIAAASSPGQVFLGECLVGSICLTFGVIWVYLMDVNKLDSIFPFY